MFPDNDNVSTGEQLLGLFFGHNLQKEANKARDVAEHEKKRQRCAEREIALRKEYFTLAVDLLSLLNKHDTKTLGKLAFSISNKKGGVGKTPIAVLLALLLQYAAKSKPILFSDTNIGMSTSLGRLSMHLDANRITYTRLVQDQKSIFYSLNGTVHELPPPKFPFTDYTALESGTMVSPAELMVIPGPPKDYVSLNFAQAALEWPLHHVFAACADTGNTSQPFDEAAFRVYRNRIFVCRVPDSDSIDGLVNTMVEYYNRGYENAVRHALICVTEADGRTTKETVFAQMCAAADAAEYAQMCAETEDLEERGEYSSENNGSIHQETPRNRVDIATAKLNGDKLLEGEEALARLGVTRKNFQEKIYLIPYTPFLSGKSDRQHPLLSMDPYGGEGFSKNPNFIGYEVGIAGFKLLIASIKQGVPSEEEEREDNERTLKSIRADIRDRGGNVDSELDFYDPHDYTLAYHLNTSSNGVMKVTCSKPASAGVAKEIASSSRSKRGSTASTVKRTP